MGFVGKVVFLVIGVAAAFLAFKMHKCLQYVPAPVMDEPWWGPGKPGKDNTEIRPFKIDVPEQVLGDLRERLARARPFTPPLEGAKQHYGFNTNLLGEILEFWKAKYNWREREQFLNKYPHFKTQIQGLDIHFMHIKPENKNKLRVVPMLMLHGWPGSIREFYEIIPMLTKPQPNKDFVFELIIPSLPGYGFSQGATKQSMGANQVAVIFKNLMERLGLKKYYLQGGDWGGVVVSNMAALYEDRVLGVHSNLCSVMNNLAQMKTFVTCMFPTFVLEQKYEDRICPIFKQLSFKLLETGYMHLQATKPDSIGVALNESPIGMAAYILEKFTTGTNPAYKDRDDGGLSLKFKYEDLLDNLMIYWVTNSMTTAARMYAESLNKEQLNKFSRVNVNVPSACSNFKYEILYQPEWILKDKYTNLVQNNHFDIGGHFAAFEVPKVLADDVWSAVEKFESIRK